MIQPSQVLLNFLFFHLVVCWLLDYFGEIYTLYLCMFNTPLFTCSLYNSLFKSVLFFLFLHSSIFHSFNFSFFLFLSIRINFILSWLVSSSYETSIVNITPQYYITYGYCEVWKEFMKRTSSCSFVSLDVFCFFS